MNSRSFSRRTFLEFLGLGIGAASLPISAAERSGAGGGGARPNVLFIPVDDLKPLLGCYGCEDIKTDSIDRLAARGTVFLNNSCQQAVCGPSRASLMTGLYPDSTGVFDLKTRMRDINPDVLSLPQYFRQNGYESTGLGKTYDPRCVDKHLDEPSWSIPYGNRSHRLTYAREWPPPVRGYQNPKTRELAGKVNRLIREKKIRDKNEKKKITRRFPGSRPPTECWDVPDDAYTDGALAEKAMELLEKLSRSEKPFFLSVGFVKPHLPFVAPKRYWDLYDRESIEPASFRKHAKNGLEFAYHNSGELRSGYTDIPSKGPLSEKKQRELIHGYMACVSYVDAQLGKLLDKVDALGIADNTVICLWGDHGWHLGDHSMWCKHSNLEQAVRAPLIIAAPDQKAAGGKTESPSCFVDIFPTLCELSGLPIPKHLQGESLVSVLDDPGASVREAALGQYPRNIDGRSAMGYTLRSKGFRYVKWIIMDYRSGERSGLLAGRELYDMKNDPLETINQADNPEFSDVVADFESILRKMNVAQHTGVYESLGTDGVGQAAGGLDRVKLNGAGEFLRCKAVRVEGVAFPKAHRVAVLSKAPQPWYAAYKRDLLIELAPGENYEVVFWCRSNAPGKSVEFTAAVKPSSAPYTPICRTSVKAGSEWHRVKLSMKPSKRYAPGESRLVCELGVAKQDILIGPMEIRVEE